MSPITPAKYYDGKLAIQLPAKLMPAFLYLSEISITHPEIGSFPTLYLAAVAGNETAIKKILEFGLIAHYAATRHAVNKEQISMANAAIFLVNQLAEMIEKKELPAYAEQPAQPAQPRRLQRPQQIQNAPVKKAEHDAKRPKPAIDKQIRFTKPGTISQEKK